MIAAANEGDVLIHCTVNANGQLDFNLKSKLQEKLAGLEQHLQVMAQSGQP